MPCAIVIRRPPYAHSPAWAAGILVFGALLASCSGTTGSPGPAGPAGAPGAPGSTTPTGSALNITTATAITGDNYRRLDQRTARGEVPGYRPERRPPSGATRRRPRFRNRAVGAWPEWFVESMELLHLQHRCTLDMPCRCHGLRNHSASAGVGRSVNDRVARRQR